MSATTTRAELDLALAQAPLFSGLPAPDRARLSAGMHPLSLPAGSLILQQGDPPDAMYVLLKGRLKVFLGNEEGREVILNFLEPGEVFGELALIDGEPRSASIMTLSAARLALLPRAHFQACLAGSPEMGSALLRLLARRLRGLADQVGNLALMDVQGRVLSVLRDQAVPDGTGGLMTGELTHQEIAQMVGASREMVTRILNELKRSGLVAIAQRRIRLTSRFPHAS